MISYLNSKNQLFTNFLLMLLTISTDFHKPFHQSPGGIIVSIVSIRKATKAFYENKIRNLKSSF
ncbi:hypothetical protein BZZ01_21990 [Nostocales cyanobacterium HT-58-2]|nr:hypothetical protein BZZ01_21990 [Nostocales cyanobacterium HT-58-2]